jgi:hypothetical protein
VLAHEGAVIRAPGLGDQTGRRHPQEAEAPEEKIEQHAAQRHAAQEPRPGKMPRHHRIDQRQYRLRQIGQNDGKRQGEHPAVPVFVLVDR